MYHTVARIDLAYISVYAECVDEDRFIVNEFDNGLNCGDFKLFLNLWEAVEERVKLAQRISSDIYWRYMEAKDALMDHRKHYC